MDWTKVQTKATKTLKSFLRIIESQNHLSWKRPLRSSSPTINLSLPSPPLNRVPKRHVYTSFKYLQGWWLNHFPGQAVPTVAPRKTCSLDPSPASLPFSGHTPAPQCPSCSEGPKTEHSTRGAASPVLSTGAPSLPYSLWPHYSWSKSGCHWPSWPHGHTAGSCSASSQPAPPGPFLPSIFLACSVAWGSCDWSAGPSIWCCWTSYSWPIDPVCPDPSAEPSYLWADQHSHQTSCCLQLRKPMKIFIFFF